MDNKLTPEFPMNNLFKRLGNKIINKAKIEEIYSKL